MHDISGLNEDPDEAKLVMCLDDISELESLEELLELESEEEFKKKYEELEFEENLLFHFIYVCSHFDAFNTNIYNIIFFKPFNLSHFSFRSV